MTLKRDAQLPLYQQLANEIKAQIASGELRQNEQLMTEMELSRTFGVSRITVRKALELLVEEDILSKRQGVGAFVTGKKLMRSMNVMMGLPRRVRQTGRRPPAGCCLPAWTRRTLRTLSCWVSKRARPCSACAGCAFAMTCR